MSCLLLQKQLPCEVFKIFSEYDHLVTFSSVHHAIRTEKLLENAGIRVAAIPTPREISVSCGQCLLFKSQDKLKVFEVIQQNDILWSKLFSRQAGGSYILLADFGDKG
ncbi:DUF3343 domain-containing protein [Dendrosporobacter sp. 1207_IL3150]|uniref:DUF3343 domain-containing protein n=1 Tax=Dendrosporobacter sp. 1207_IL3150 TaxID=3084054 RepID=UPI002FDB1603